MTIAVRALGLDDKDSWRQLFGSYLEFYEAALDEAVIDLTWDRLMTPQEGHHRGLVAEIVQDNQGAGAPADQGKPAIVGIAHYLMHRSTWSPTFYCYLEDLFVDPDQRGAGAGRALIEAVYAAADAQGCTRTYWATQDFNHTARGLYDKVATKSPFIQYRR